MSKSTAKHLILLSHLFIQKIPRQIHEVSYLKSEENKLKITCFFFLIILPWIPKWIHRIRPIALFFLLLRDPVFKATQIYTSLPENYFTSLVKKIKALDMNTYFIEISKKMCFEHFNLPKIRMHLLINCKSTVSWINWQWHSPFLNGAWNQCAPPSH